MSEFSFNETISTPAFYVLLALTNKVLHAYGIREQVAHDSDGGLILAMGTVYPLLDRLVERRLLERVEVAPAERVACRYRLTTAGRQVLEAEVSRLERVASQARYKLGPAALRGRFAA